MVESHRTLGFPVAFAMGLGTMIAAGIFSLSGTAVAEIGSSAVIAFVIAAVIAGLTAAAYSEFASIYSESGGGYLFTSRTLENDYIVYAEGIMLFLGYSATTAFYLATMGEWVHKFIYPIEIPLGLIGLSGTLAVTTPAWMVGVVVALLLGALNATGTEESGGFQMIVTGAKVAVLFAFIGGAFAFQSPSTTVGTFATSFTADLPGIISIASLAFITFFGFSAIAASAGEIKKPRETVPKAIAASILTVTVLYALVIVAMVNSPIPAEVIAEQGETAMGSVASAFLGPIGQSLIVAGAIFSMISASNASILAASRIGYLMGKEGRAFRRLQNIHPSFGTPIWGVGACTFTIVALIFVFTGLFPGHGSTPWGLHLGLAALTGFANFNLLIPLSVVDAALIVSRRKYPDIERPFKIPDIQSPVHIPLSTILLIIAILANLALIASLPMDGVVSGVVGLIAFVIIYLIWGGAPSVDELMSQVDKSSVVENDEGGGRWSVEEEDEYRILIPVARSEDVKSMVLLADKLTSYIDANRTIEVIHISKIPGQVPSDAVDTTTEEKVLNEFESEIESIKHRVNASVEVEVYVSRNTSFTIIERAREIEADLIFVGYPEEHRDVAAKIQHKTPCDVIYTFGITDETGMETVNIGAGTGPNHRALLPLVDKMGADGAEIHLINVTPEYQGTEEPLENTLAGLQTDVTVHSVEDRNVARGLVDTAAKNGGVLMIGASRTFLLKNSMLGSTPDHVIDLAEEVDLPVLVYRSPATISGKMESAFFLAYRYAASLF